MHCEEEKCTVVLVVLQMKKKNAVVYIDRIQYLLELVPDPKKGELHLLQLEPVRKGSISISKKELAERSIFILENHNNFQIRKPHA